MIVSHQDESLLVTDHALLIAYAHFAGQIGLIGAVERVPFPMKTFVHSPADKVVELLCHVLAGGMHINELAKSAHPLVYDQAVARAWGQTSFASASGVSALLESASGDGVEALKTVLGQVMEP